jgi:hypothetical protein
VRFPVLLDLPDVSGPSVFGETSPGRLRQTRRRHSGLGGGTLQEAIEQQPDVTDAFTDRREPEREDGQSMVEVFTLFPSSLCVSSRPERFSCPTSAAASRAWSGLRFGGTRLSISMSAILARQST